MAWQKKHKKKSPALFRFIRFLAWVIFPKFTTEGTENLPDEAVIFVGNHSKANGPVFSQLYTPRECYTWTISSMMNKKKVPDYAYTDFWSKKPKCIRWIYRLTSYIIGPIAAYVMTNADTIAVYHDKRVLNTFKESVEMMEEGTDIFVFPECYDEHNNIVHDFQRGFIDVARVDFKKTKRSTPFVPVYICPELKRAVFGKPIYYNNENDAKEEKERVANALMDAISEIAYSLPEHRVVQYNNIRKRHCPKNIRQ